MFSWPRAGLTTLPGWSFSCYMWWPYRHTCCAWWAQFEFLTVFMTILYPPSDAFCMAHVHTCPLVVNCIVPIIVGVRKERCTRIGPCHGDTWRDSTRHLNYLEDYSPCAGEQWTLNVDSYSSPWGVVDYLSKNLSSASGTIRRNSPIHCDST